jgi:hypothetical protein
MSILKIALVIFTGVAPMARAVTVSSKAAAVYTPIPLNVLFSKSLALMPSKAVPPPSLVLSSTPRFVSITGEERPAQILLLTSEAAPILMLPPCSITLPLKLQKVAFSRTAYPRQQTPFFGPAA